MEADCVARNESSADYIAQNDTKVSLAQNGE
jgi:hypothetical protein